MRILATGTGGFVGRHLTKELTENNHTVFAFEHPDSKGAEGAIETIFGNICDPATIEKAVTATKPEACIHLAAISFVPDGISNPQLMKDVNEGGTANLLAILNKHTPACRTLVVSTALIYGPSKSDARITEDNKLSPANLYAETKANADLAALAFTTQHDLPVMTARPHNHIGPGQSPKFVVPSFVQQAKAIAAGTHPPVMHVGNLESERDFTDVRDVVKAYRLIIEKGKTGNAYNIASDKLYKIGDILNMILDIAGAQPEIKTDDTLYRPTDKSPQLDVSKLKNDTGWEYETDLNTSLSDIFKDTES